MRILILLTILLIPMRHGIDKVLPLEGKSGDTIIVEGKGFTPETLIYLDDVKVSSKFINSNKVSFIVPSNLESGQVMLKVVTKTVGSTRFSGFKIK